MNVRSIILEIFYIMRAKMELINITYKNKTDFALEPLTAERFRELWSRTYNTEGKPDWSHIFPYYHENIVFEDCIQRIEWIEEFKAMCVRLTKCCEQLSMQILSLATNPDEIFFQWKLVMMFNQYPNTPVNGHAIRKRARHAVNVNDVAHVVVPKDTFQPLPRST